MEKSLKNVAGTFLIQADASFLNGAGLGEGEDRNVTVPKTFQDGKDRVPYVSSQAWKRWLRNTLIEETGWEDSEIRAIGLSEKGTTNKISGELNPVDFVEDDIFGYMEAKKGQGKAKETDEDNSEVDDDVAVEKKSRKNKVKSVMRTSPFSASLLVSIRKTGWRGRDEGFVHLKEGTPQPYTTEFYNANLQGIFSLNYARLGVFNNVGDRIELDEDKADCFMKTGKICNLTDKNKTNGTIYEIINNPRKERATALLKALAVLRGGAKQAQFGTDIAPKIIVLAGLNCGNPIFNHLFVDSKDGPELKIETLKEVIHDYSDRIVTPVYIGVRTGYLKNDCEVKKLDKSKIDSIEIRISTPIEAACKMAGELK